MNPRQQAIVIVVKKRGEVLREIGYASSGWASKRAELARLDEGYRRLLHITKHIQEAR